MVVWGVSASRCFLASVYQPPHTTHTHPNTSGLYTGTARSTWPKWPAHADAVRPQVAQLCGGCEVMKKRAPLACGVSFFASLPPPNRSPPATGCQHSSLSEPSTCGANKTKHTDTHRSACSSGPRAGSYSPPATGAPRLSRAMGEMIRLTESLRTCVGGGGGGAAQRRRLGANAAARALPAARSPQHPPIQCTLDTQTPSPSSHPPRHPCRRRR